MSGRGDRRRHPGDLLTRQERLALRYHAEELDRRILTAEATLAELRRLRENVEMERRTDRDSRAARKKRTA